MLEIDRFALHTLQCLVEKARKAFDVYEFHVIYHSLYNYCTLDLSAFYLDILKDRLYTSLPQSLERRSAQTVLHILLDALARLMAPILPFTAEEIWQYMPVRNGKEPSVHLTLLPEVNSTYKDDTLAETWNTLLNVRGEVTKAMESARAAKRIGHPLDASITLSVKGDLYDELRPYAAELRSLLIVSKATLVKETQLNGAFESSDIQGLFIGVEPAPGDKCERCWVHDPTVGHFPDQPTICHRCQTALAKLN
jgi:isoleucyl-tRNA synthetase